MGRASQTEPQGLITHESNHQVCFRTAAQPQGQGPKEREHPPLALPSRAFWWPSLASAAGAPLAARKDTPLPAGGRGGGWGWGGEGESMR